MKKVIKREPDVSRNARISVAPRARRVGVAEAKAKLSQALHSLQQGPIIIHSRGRDVGALMDISTYERLMAANDQGGALPGGAAFLERVEELKKRHGGGVEEFDPAPAVLRPQNPFRGRSQT